MIPNIVGPEYVADLMRMPLATIKVYARSRPDSLPPRWRPPGIRKLLWLEEDVLDWVRSFGAVPQKRRGRPTLASQQSQPEAL